MLLFDIIDLLQYTYIPHKICGLRMTRLYDMRVLNYRPMFNLLLDTVYEPCNEPIYHNNNTIADNAAGNGHFELLKWLLVYKPVTNNATKFAAIGGHLNIIKYLDTKLLYDIIIEKAVQYNHIAIVKWAFRSVAILNKI